MDSIRRIGVLTGGGDCPGLNAVIRAVTKDALYHGFEVLGIADGFLGLIEDRVRTLEYDDVSNILTRGGTILGSSNKANPARFCTGAEPDGSPIFSDVTGDCLATIQRHRIDALVVIGGDGTMSAASRFVDLGVPCVGVPKTIDNDIVGTELTFGFLSAVATATEALDRVHTTAASHHRALVVEVMGRNAGWIALHAGVASGSDVILLPEIPYEPSIVADLVRRRSMRGTRYSILCVAEGARAAGGEQVVDRLDPTSPDPVRLGGIAQRVARDIEADTGVESRHVVLGHVLRGGSPVAADRVLATQFGHHAMELLKSGQTQRLVVWTGGQLGDVPIQSAAHQQRTIPMDHPLLAAARSVYTGFGDGRSPRTPEHAD